MLSVPIARHKAIQLVSMIVKAATILFKSTCAKSLSVASKIPITEIAQIRACTPAPATQTNFIKPRTPNLTKKPLRNIENSVEASTWAFSSQEEKGQSGTFIAKPAKANAMGASAI